MLVTWWQKEWELRGRGGCRQTARQPSLHHESGKPPQIRWAENESSEGDSQVDAWKGSTSHTENRQGSAQVQSRAQLSGRLTNRKEARPGAEPGEELGESVFRGEQGSDQAGPCMPVWGRCVLLDWVEEPLEGEKWCQWFFTSSYYISGPVFTVSNAQNDLLSTYFHSKFTDEENATFSGL